MAYDGVIEFNGKSYMVVELESKDWHDNDMYLVKCMSCGNSEKSLARRPYQAISDCNCSEWF